MKKTTKQQHLRRSPRSGRASSAGPERQVPAAEEDRRRDARRRRTFRGTRRAEGARSACRRTRSCSRRPARRRPRRGRTAARLVSAKPATMKIRKPTNCGTTYQMPSCASTMSVSDSEPRHHDHADAAPGPSRPRRRSAARRRASRRGSEYFEPEAQPPSSRP